MLSLATGTRSAVQSSERYARDCFRPSSKRFLARRCAGRCPRSRDRCCGTASDDTPRSEWVLLYLHRHDQCPSPNETGTEICEYVAVAEPVFDAVLVENRAE